MPQESISLSPTPPPGSEKDASSQASSSHNVALPMVSGSGARVPTQFLDKKGSFSRPATQTERNGITDLNGTASSSKTKREPTIEVKPVPSADTVDLTSDDGEEITVVEARGPGLIRDQNEQVCIGLVNAVVLTMLGLPDAFISLPPPRPGDYNSDPKWSYDQWPPGAGFYLEPGFRPVQLLPRGTSNGPTDKAEISVHEVVPPLDVQKHLKGTGVPIPAGPQLKAEPFGTLADKYNRALHPLLARRMVNLVARCRIVAPNSGQNFLHAIEVLCFASRRNGERVSNFLYCENVHLEYPHSYRASMFEGSPPCEMVSRNVQANASPYSQFTFQSRGTVMHTKEATAQEKKRQVDAVYASLRDGEDLEMVEASDNISTPLLPHQKQALAFLLDREKQRSFVRAAKDEIVSLWKPVKRGERIISYQHVVTQGEQKRAPAICRGAILADDMGLGKTLVAIALVAKTADEAQRFARAGEEGEESGQQGKQKEPSKAGINGKEDVDDDDDDEVTIEDFSINVPGAPPPKKKPKVPKKKGKREQKKEELAANRLSEIKARSRATLVVLPLTLVSAWEAQIDEHWIADQLPSIYIYHGAGRMTDVEQIADHDIVMTTYATLASEYAATIAEDEESEGEGEGPDRRKGRNGGSNDDKLYDDDDDVRLVDSEGNAIWSGQSSRANSKKPEKKGKRKRKAEERPTSPLQQIQWFRIVLDEAHTIKEARTLQSRAVCNLLGIRRLCLTGTPVQNRIDDLFSLIRFLRLEPFDDRGVWNQFCGSKEKAASLRSARRKEGNDKNNEPLDQMALARVQTIMKFLTLRRTKETKMADGRKLLTLPAKYSRILTLQFDPRERGIYEEMRIRYREDFEQMQQSNTLKHNYATILHEISNLRMTCDHMGLVDASKDAKRKKDFGEDDNPATAILRDGMSRDRAIGLFEVLSSSDRARCQLCSHDLSTFGDEAGIAIADVVKNAVLTKCLHLFCSDCLRTHIGQGLYNQPKPDDRFSCPECSESVSPLLEIRELLPADVTQVIGDNDRSLTDETFGVDKGVDFDQRPDYSSKITALVIELEAFSKCNPSSLLYDPEAPVLDQTVGPAGDENSEPVQLVSSTDRPAPIKSVIFSQWTKMLDRIAKAVHRAGIKAGYLDGRMRRQERSDNLERFKNDDSVEILLVSLKAGGIGLNLVSACRAYLMEPYWNPAIENQGLDRVHRMGQTRPVITTKFVMDNSIEENMLELQRRKLKLAESVGEKRTAERQREELNLLFSARQDGEERGRSPG